MITVTNEAAGAYVANIAAPVTPAELAELAAALPADALLTDMEVDHDGALFMAWEVASVTPLD
jgi:hypothetical protein